MAQIKNKLDDETVSKIKKGALWALSGPVGLALIDLAMKAPKSAWWGIAIAWIVPTVINAVREYKKGEDVQSFS